MPPRVWHDQFEWPTRDAVAGAVEPSIGTVGHGRRSVDVVLKSAASIAKQHRDLAWLMYASARRF